MYFCRKLVGIMAKNSLAFADATLSAETCRTEADVQSADGRIES